MGYPAWIPEREARLREMYATGASFSVIAADLGMKSRNSVIGKAHRLKLIRPKRPKAADASIVVAKEPRAAKQRLHPGTIALRAARKAEERQESFVAMADEALDRFNRAVVMARGPDAAGLPFLARGRLQCAMPLPGWDSAPVADKMVCGRPVTGATSWCERCFAIVYQPPRFRDFKDRQARMGIAA